MTMSFNVIVGNPPYQGRKSHDGPEGKPPTIWPKFVEKNNTLLKDNGVMILVHPAMYRKPGNPLQEVLLNNNRELHIYNNAEAMRTFGGCSTRYDWYVIDKSYTGKTQVHFEDDTQFEIQLTPEVFLPNGSWSIWEKVQELGRKVGAIQTHKKTDRPSLQGEYEVVQTVTKTKGVVIRQTDKKPKSYGVKKVILSETGCQALLDWEGVYGTSCNTYYVEITTKEEGESLVRFVYSKLCHHLVKSCKWGNFRTEHCIWTYMPNPHNLGITPSCSEEDIYKAFGLSPDEINHIEHFQYGKAR